MARREGVGICVAVDGPPFAIGALATDGEFDAQYQKRQYDYRSSHERDYLVERADCKKPEKKQGDLDEPGIPRMCKESRKRFETIGLGVLDADAI
jgi:hypothetical protein